MNSKFYKLSVLHILALAFGIVFLLIGLSLLTFSYTIMIGGPYEHIAILGILFFYLGGGVVSTVIGIILLIIFYIKYKKIKVSNE
jgi:hypothetical protein